MAGKTPGTDVELLSYDRFALATMDDAALEVMRENVGNSQVGVFDLDRVKIPAGGGRTWEVPTLEGVEAVPYLDGIIVHWRDPRAFWQTSLDDSGGGSPPDCTSDTGDVGRGMYGVGSDLHPSGECLLCPMAAWGSKEGDSNAQACKQMRLMFFLRPTDRVPLALFMPPTSLKPMRQFFLRLVNGGVPYYGIITRLGLEQSKSQGGFTYSRVVPSVLARLDDEQTASVRAFGNSIRDTLDAVKLTIDDVRDVSDDGGPLERV